MKISVPHFKQGKGSSDCGLVCAQMILSYFKKGEDIAQLKKDLAVRKEGTSNYQIGKFFLKKGFNVTITTQNPYVFSLFDRGVSQATLKRRVAKLANDPFLKKQKEEILYLLEFINAGGLVDVAIPNISHINKSIKVGNPLIALCTTQFITDKKSRFNFHLVVVKGYDAKNIIINDPDGRNRKRDTQRIITHEDFFYGLHASAAGDADNASLLSISK